MSRFLGYINDIVYGTRVAIDKNFKCEVFNLGNNRSEDLMDMIGLIEKELGKKAIIDFKPMQPGDVYESFADIKYSMEKINFKPKTTINEGIPNFIKWYKEYYNGTSPEGL